jgi:hypothetical protein
MATRPATLSGSRGEAPSSDLSGSADHRDAQIRHAITRLPHWAKRCGVAAIAIEDLDFS